MREAAAHVAGVFESDGHTWQERPVRPPAYKPTKEQIHDLYMELLAEVVARRPNEVTGRAYDFAQRRGLRVLRLTKPDEAEQRFVLQAQTKVDGRAVLANVQIVDAEGKPAEWTPPERTPPASKAELQAALVERDNRIAELEAKVEQLAKGRR